MVGSSSILESVAPWQNEPSEMKGGRLNGGPDAGGGCPAQARCALCRRDWQYSGRSSLLPRPPEPGRKRAPLGRFLGFPPSPRSRPVFRIGLRSYFTCVIIACLRPACPRRPPLEGGRAPAWARRECLWGPRLRPRLSGISLDTDVPSGGEAGPGPSPPHAGCAWDPPLGDGQSPSVLPLVPRGLDRRPREHQHLSPWKPQAAEPLRADGMGLTPRPAWPGSSVTAGKGIPGPCLSS